MCSVGLAAGKDQCFSGVQHLTVEHVVAVVLINTTLVFLDSLSTEKFLFRFIFESPSYSLHLATEQSWNAAAELPGQCGEM